jgi:hypothetical protein
MTSRRPLKQRTIEHQHGFRTRSLTSPREQKLGPPKPPTVTVKILKAKPGINGPAAKVGGGGGGRSPHIESEEA